MNACIDCGVEFAPEESCSDAICAACLTFRVWFYGEPHPADVEGA